VEGEERPLRFCAEDFFTEKYPTLLGSSNRRR
jgi:hypothetical protein